MDNVTRRDIWEARSAIGSFLSKEIPVELAYSCAKILRAIRYEVEDLDMMRKKILMAQAKKDDKGVLMVKADGQVDITVEGEGEYNRQFSEFLSEETKCLADFPRIPIGVISAAVPTMTTGDMIPLLFLFKDKPEI